MSKAAKKPMKLRADPLPLPSKEEMLANGFEYHADYLKRYLRVPAMYALTVWPMHQVGAAEMSRLHQHMMETFGIDTKNNYVSSRSIIRDIPFVIYEQFLSEGVVEDSTWVDNIVTQLLELLGIEDTRDNVRMATKHVLTIKEDAE